MTNEFQDATYEVLKAKELVKAYEQLLQELTLRVRQFDDKASLESIEYWRFRILKHAIFRVKTFLAETNEYVETLRTLTLSRYLFELVIWLKLIQLEEKYVLDFAQRYLNELLEGSGNYTTQVEREIELFEALGKQERPETTRFRLRTVKEALRKYANEEQREAWIAKKLSAINHEAEGRLKDKFALYGSEVVFHGDFASHAGRLRRVVLPQAIKEEQGYEESARSFAEAWGDEVKNFASKRWVWKDKAAKAGMEWEFDYIYSYTSRLLHAKPSSVLVSQQSLTAAEFFIFWRFIHHQCAWIHDYASAIASAAATKDGH